MVQVNPMVVKPPLVVRLRDESPLMAQAEMNSVTEAAKNWELVLADIFEKSLMKIHKKVSSWVHDDPVGQYTLVFIMSKSHILEVAGCIRNSNYIMTNSLK